jgi:hypothetical protein
MKVLAPSNLWAARTVSRLEHRERKVLEYAIRESGGQAIEHPANEHLTEKWRGKKHLGRRIAYLQRCCRLEICGQLVRDREGMTAETAITIPNEDVKIEDVDEQNIDSIPIKVSSHPARPPMLCLAADTLM